MARCWSLRWCNWVGEGERGERELLPLLPRTNPRPGTHTAHTCSPTTRRRRHSRVSARLPLPHCGARRQTAEEQRAPLLVCPTPPLRRSSRRGRGGVGRRAKAHFPTTTCPQGAPLPWPAVYSTTARRRKKGDTQPDMLLGYNSAICVQKFNDSRKSAIHTTFRALLRSSSTHEPRDPLFRVVFWFLVVFFRALLCSAAREKEIDCRVHMGCKETRGRGVCGFLVWNGQGI